MLKLESNFFEKYWLRSFLHQQKALILTYFLLVALVLLSIIAVFNNLSFESGLLTSANMVRVILIGSCIWGLLLVRGGHYEAAANLLLFFAGGALALQASLVEYQHPIALVARLFYFPIFIVLGAVFCTQRSNLMATLLLTCLGLIAILRSNVVSGSELTLLISSFMTLMIFIYVLTFLLLRIVGKAILKLEEGQKSEDENRAIKTLIKAVDDISGNLASHAEDLSRENHDLSMRTTRQAASVEEISAVMEQAVDSITKNASHSESADDLAQGAVHIAEDGVDVVEDAVAAINTIVDSSKKIENILEVLKEISFQTNLLALNASVEAARAGDMGRGFGVVAGEVRNLAQRSAVAAKEIEGHIRETITNIDNGYNQVNKSGELIKQINQSINEVSTLISQIAVTSRRQKDDIDQISSSLMYIDETTQENSQLVEKTAQVSNEISQHASRLISLLRSE